MSCKRGGFVSIRHNDLRGLTADMLTKVCKDIEIEPKLTPLIGKEFGSRTANTTNEARLDIRACGVWERGQQLFLDLRIFDPNTCPYCNKSLQQCHVMNEQEKKRTHNERVLQLEHDLFTSLVFSVYGSMGRECRTFYSRLSDLLSEKRDLPKSITMNFALLKTSFLCLRGSRAVCRKVAEFKSDVVVYEFKKFLQSLNLLEQQIMQII